MTFCTKKGYNLKVGIFDAVSGHEKLFLNEGSLKEVFPNTNSQK